jgi:hypothetical protein
VSGPRISLWRRALWHANRTPAARVIKAAVSLAHRADKMARAQAARAHDSDAVAAARATELEAKGHCMVSDLADPGLLSELERDSLGRVERAEQARAAQKETHKAFWVRLLDDAMVEGALDCDNVFVRFALQPRVVAVLAHLLGELPRLTDVLLTYSTPSDEALSYSQLWHRDYDDVRTVKLFAYLTDVTGVADGPFTFLPGPQSDRVGFSVRSHLADEAFFSRARPDAVQQVRAPRRSVFLCETSRCYHMGSRVADGHARLMYTATFISSPNVYPEGPPRFRATRPLSAAERLLLGLSQGVRA